MDPKRDLKIKLLRERGKTYEEIKKELHVGRSTISKVLAMGDMGSDAGPSRIATTASPPVVEDHLYREKRTIKSDRTVAQVGHRTMDGGTGTGGTTFLNKKRTRFVADRNGLRIISIDNPGSSNSQLIYAPLPSWFWKLFFVFIGIVIFIRILKKIREDAFEDN